MIPGGREKYWRRIIQSCRNKVAIKKLSDYLEGKTKVIEELEEELLCFNGHDKDFEKDYDNCEYRWRRMTSVNVND